MSNAEVTQVIGMLAILAEQCSEKASDQRLAWMASKLVVHGLQPCATAIESLMSSARRFPTVSEIEREMGVGAASVDTEAIGREIADKIYTAMRKFGAWKNRRQQVEEFLGPVGIEVVRQLGGWEYLCATTLEDDIPILKAQWRESAIGVAERIKRGDLNAVPGAQLAAIPQKPGLNAVDTTSMLRLISAGGETLSESPKTITPVDQSRG
jgi:hypothetical protein